MLYALFILLLLIAAILSLPSGMEFIRERGLNRQKLIVCGLRFPFRMKKSSERKEKKAAESAQERERKKAESIPVVLQDLNVEDVQAVWTTLRRFSNSVHLRMHKLVLNIATPDPAVTGMLYGLSCAGIGAFNASDKITLNADFSHEIPAFDYRIEVSLIPGRAVWESIGALWRLVLRKPQRRRMLFSAIGRKKKHV
ncbi:DUF2953 domain-containing protein [candidate division KSB1 bacterium]|nr:MAG: DUF2953 domain-containing protein [candidate division KSB1 bacterium]